ncbi:hypothetical protein M426DRAFT_14609 [Hypoxylon sp. CI-4A]|nr:hypothetical protein M426DRAFT_14609 [Hypoxylon sp. CI-4A]
MSSKTMESTQETGDGKDTQLSKEQIIEVPEHQPCGPSYITGWRLYAITAGISLGLFLVNFEVTIVSTALVSITNDLDNYNRSSWVITAYLLTYTGCLVLWARLSDILGRKSTCLAAVFIFATFSGGCAASQTMVQLIICRVFQGIGGSGIYGLTTIIIYELVPPPKYPLYTSIIMVMFAVAFALGPVFGGLITDGSTWRWVFLLNVPSSAVVGVLLLLAIPNNFPYHNQPTLRPQRHSFRALDFAGIFLLLAALTLLITGLEQGASQLRWASASVLAPLCISAVAWVAFLAVERYHSVAASSTEPIFPWKFCKNRRIMGLFLNTFMIGAVSVTSIVLIPLRYQAASGLKPLDAGVRLILFSAVYPVGAIIAATLCKNRRVAPLYLMLFGEMLQIVGFVLITQVSANDLHWNGLYGLQVLVGVGLGFVVGTATLMTPAIVERKDLAIASAAVVQFRFLGGAVGVSVTTAVGNSWVKAASASLLSSDEAEAIFRSLETIKNLPSALENDIREIFLRSFTTQMYIILGFAVAATFCSLLMWQKQQLKVA